MRYCFGSPADDNEAEAYTVFTGSGFSSSGLFLMNSTTTGVATKREEYVPNIIPISMAKENPRSTSPPKINRMIRTSMVQRPVTTVRLSVLRSEEQTSELQSLMRISYAVFCLKKKNMHN